METLAATKTNVQTVQQAFDNFLKGNIPAVVDACTSDVEWSSYNNPDVPYSSTYHGKDGVLQFFTNLGATVNYSVFEPKKYFTDGDDVVVLGHHTGTVISTGKTFDHDWSFHFEVKNGKLNRFFAYVDSRDQSQAFKG